MPENKTRQNRHASVKQSILKTAMALIIDKGIAKLSLREIARKAGYSPASLYEYFEGKDEIIAQLSAEAFDRLRIYLGQPPTTIPPDKRLIEIGMAYVKFARENPGHYDLVFNRLPSKRSTASAEINAASPYMIVRQAVVEAIESGSIVMSRGYDLEAITYSLWSLAHGMATLQNTHLSQFEADFDKVNRSAFETFIKGLGT